MIRKVDNAPAERHLAKDYEPPFQMLFITTPALFAFQPVMHSTQTGRYVKSTRWLLLDKVLMKKLLTLMRLRSSQILQTLNDAKSVSYLVSLAAFLYT